LTHAQCRIQAAVSFEPGNYILDTTVIDNLSGRIGHLPKEISIPDRSNGNLAMSDILLTLATGKEKPSADSLLQRIASVQKTFHPGDEINIYFEVYNLAQSTEGKTSEFSVEYAFLQGDKIIAAVPLSPQSLTNTRDQEMSTSFKLKNFHPGTYRLQARVHDLVSGENTIKEASFQIVQ
jgi:hypothetical protein